MPDQHWFSAEPEEIKRDFELYERSKRAEALDQLDEHLRTLNDGEIRSHARLMRLRRDLGKTHADLIKVRR